MTAAFPAPAAGDGEGNKTARATKRTGCSGAVWRREYGPETQKKSRRPGIWLIAIFLCLATAFGLGWYKYSQIRSAMAFAAAFPEPVEAVEGFTARESFWQPTTRVTGK